MFPNDVMAEAGHVLFADAYARHAEEDGHSYSQCDICEVIKPESQSQIVPVVANYIGHIEEAWGFSVPLVFYHMGIVDSDDETRALADLLLGCLGHGVSLNDRFADALDEASNKLGHKLEAAPTHLDDSLIWNVAYNAYQRRKRRG